jgi:hypothetical protein
MFLKGTECAALRSIRGFPLAHVTRREMVGLDPAQAITAKRNGSVIETSLGLKEVQPK